MAVYFASGGRARQGLISSTCGDTLFEFPFLPGHIGFQVMHSGTWPTARSVVQLDSWHKKACMTFLFSSDTRNWGKATQLICEPRDSIRRGFFSSLIGIADMNVVLYLLPPPHAVLYLLLPPPRLSYIFSFPHPPLLPTPHVRFDGSM